MRWKSDLILLFVAVVWGSGFVPQRLATEANLGTFYFNGGRFLLAAVLLLPLALWLKRGSTPPRLLVKQKELPWMALAGTLLFLAAGLQQAGLATTSVGNASFITGLYVVLIPVILLIFWRQRTSWFSWAAVGLATVGAMLLSLQGELRLSSGDVLELVGALVWALHVILVGRLAERGFDPFWFSVIQFTTCGLWNLALAVGIDPLGVQTLVQSWWIVLFSAAIPIGLGFTLQIVGQRHAPAVDAAIILSMEAVFGTFFAYLAFQETLTMRQLFGCALILIAMILAQLRPSEALELETA